jgi:hypothetical protein
MGQPVLIHLTVSQKINDIFDSGEPFLRQSPKLLYNRLFRTFVLCASSLLTSLDAPGDFYRGRKCVGD